MGSTSLEPYIIDVSPGKALYVLLYLHCPIKLLVFLLIILFSFTLLLMLFAKTHLCIVCAEPCFPQ